MSPILVLCACLLGAQAADPSPTAGPVEARQAEALAKYNERKESTAETAAAQWALALWCEKNGLNAEAKVHFASVVRLDPTREAAWKKLGMRKVRGRWFSEDDLAEEAARKKDEAVWAPRLKKIHKAIHVARKEDDARKALDAVTDPAAAASVYREFAGGGATDQTIAVEALGHIVSPLSSKLLAVLAIYGKSPEVRRSATETLRRRDPDDFLDVLVGHMADPIKYEVRPVGGPGSPGVLFVEGQRFNVRRVYAAPAAPNVTPMPGDIISYDAAGMPVIERPNGLFGISLPLSGAAKSGGLNFNVMSAVVYSPFRAMAEAQRAAASSQVRLQSDIEELDTLNEQRKRFTDLVIDAAKAATGKDLGRAPDNWRDAVAGRNPYPRKGVKPTVSELVPPGYVPNLGGEVTLIQTIGFRLPDN